MTDFESSSMRISDADRESAMTALGEHMSTGRLTVDEYGERAAQVAAAKTRQELFAQFTDLPEPWPKLVGSGTTTAMPTPQPAPVVRSRARTGATVAALIPVTWVAALLVTIITGYGIVFLIPALLTVFGIVLLARGIRRVGRRVAGNFNQATGFTGFTGDWVRRDYQRDYQYEDEGYDGCDDRYDRYAARWERRAARYAQRGAWHAGSLGQMISAEIERGMRGAYGYGRGNYGRGGQYRHRHHGRRYYR
ncbi:MAG TPA: DUF1707 domain-containing protein [Pseudonocardiaceae bacterium]